MNSKEFKQWIWRKDYISHSERIAFDPAYADVEYKTKRKMETRKCKTCGLELPIGVRCMHPKQGWAANELQAVHEQ